MNELQLDSSLITSPNRINRRVFSKNGSMKPTLKYQKDNADEEFLVLKAINPDEDESSYI